jgi:hypothetical protein
MRKEHVYILRFWSDADGDDHWRASLEHVHTRECKAFADLSKLAAFLEAQTLQKKSETTKS